MTSVYPAGTAGDLLRRTRVAFGRDHDPSACVRPETVAAVILGAPSPPSDAQVGEIDLPATS
ncbi:hypothetical protein PWG71_12275 [Nocardiopsis sp. N85]|uniref:hypothetical protein n=1 Tax=Nocardiopsis sp. N85 TaxID=3029400 RepID=UPI00237F8278|nr:hypothetical protein [Nocardiopsis sp. N85]MDE3722167.1 hypothetical protein [Nocardiopsis sp. N85]